MWYIATAVHTTTTTLAVNITPVRIMFTLDPSQDPIPVGIVFITDVPVYRVELYGLWQNKELKWPWPIIGTGTIVVLTYTFACRFVFFLQSFVIIMKNALCTSLVGSKPVLGCTRCFSFLFPCLDYFSIHCLSHLFCGGATAILQHYYHRSLSKYERRGSLGSWKQGYGRHVGKKRWQGTTPTTAAVGKACLCYYSFVLQTAAEAASNECDLAVFWCSFLPFLSFVLRVDLNENFYFGKKRRSFFKC